MVTLERKKRFRNHFTKKEIPKSLIYEMYDGKPMYYKGFKEVMNQIGVEKEVSFRLDNRTVIVNGILQNLIKNLDSKKYFIAGNGISLQVSENTITTSNILIFDTQILQDYKFGNQFFDIIPLVTFDIDFIAETDDFGINEFNYYSMKTRKLLDFGVKEVYCFFSSTKQVAIARPNEDWIISDWNKVLNVLGEYQFSLNNLLEKEGFNL